MPEIYDYDDGQNDTEILPDSGDDRTYVRDGLTDY